LTAALVATVTLAAVATPVALASDEQGRYAIKGFGQTPCSQFTEAREERKPGYLVMGGWVEGYLTALNEVTPATFDLTSFETTDLLAGLIDRHCRQNPQHRFADVVRAMAKGLVEQRLQTFSDAVPLEVNGRTTLLYRETVRRLQARLVELGHLEAELDGELDEATRTALEAYQGSVGVEPTGLPDQLTLLRLFRAIER
jgi:hypothetical protein